MQFLETNRPTFPIIRPFRNPSSLPNVASVDIGCQVEVAGSNPATSWAAYLLSFYPFSVLKLVPHGGGATLFNLLKIDA